MADSDLRELERAVLERGDAATRIRLARALERAGRRDEIYSVLRPAVADRGARQILLDLPAWRYPEADTGATNVVDVPPLVRTPRVRQLREGKPSRFPEALVATEAGLVVVERVSGGMRAVFLDSESGRERTQLEVSSPRIALVGGAILTGSLEARSLWSGELVRDVRIQGKPLLAFEDRTVLANEGARIVALAWKDRLTRLWDQPVATEECSVAASSSWLVVWSEARELRALRRSDGNPLWSFPTSAPASLVRMDEEGLVMRPQDASGSDLYALDREGNVLWSSDETAKPLALGKDWVIAAVRRGRHADCELVVLDRETGDRRAALHGAPVGFWTQPVCVAVARGTVYFTVPRQHALVAATLSGDVLWRASLEDTGQILALAPGARCVYAACMGGAVQRFSDDA